MVGFGSPAYKFNFINKNKFMVVQIYSTQLETVAKRDEQKDENKICKIGQLYSLIMVQFLPTNSHLVWYKKNYVAARGIFVPELLSVRRVPYE